MRERPCVQSGSRRVSLSRPAEMELRLKLPLASAPALIQVMVGRGGVSCVSRKGRRTRKFGGGCRTAWHGPQLEFHAARRGLKEPVWHGLLRVVYEMKKNCHRNPVPEVEDHHLVDLRS